MGFSEVSIFELVKVTLDELYEQGEKRYPNNLDEKIKEQIVHLSLSYRQLCETDRPVINYQDPATRFAYVYKYVTAHSNFLLKILNDLHDTPTCEIFNGEVCRVSCIGGGPGSDIIAILKHLNENSENKVKKLICYLLDKEQGWADTWTELDSKININLNINNNFQPLNITDHTSWENQTKFLEADVFTLSYFLSEVLSLDGDGSVTRFFTTLFRVAKPGAYFIYSDNGHSVFDEFFTGLFDENDFEAILTESKVSWRVSNEEQKSDLGIYREKLTQEPKLTGEISYKVIRKK